jgi:hypothetical protein
MLNRVIACTSLVLWVVLWVVLLVVLPACSTATSDSGESDTAGVVDASQTSDVLVAPDVADPEDAAIPDVLEVPDVPETGPDVAPEPDVPEGPECGDEVLDSASISGTEGLSIAPDGTVYYSQTGGVGRRLPGEAADSSWLSLPGASTVWGLALRADGALFVASPSNGTIYRVDTTASPPTVSVATSSAGQPNGLIVGPDEAVYYSDFGGGHVYRLADGGEPAAVTASLMSQPNGLLFDPDGTLLVLEYSKGAVWRLTLDAGMVETDRGLETNIPGSALDGIGRDDSGRYLLTDNGGGRLLRLDATFEHQEVLLTGVSAAANLAFGRGALSCDDIYVTSAGALARYDTSGD